MSGPAAGVGKPHDFPLIIGSQLSRIVGADRGQHLDAVSDRPFGEAASQIGTFLEGHRKYAGLLDRPADPDVMVRRGMER